MRPSGRPGCWSTATRTRRSPGARRRRRGCTARARRGGPPQRRPVDARGAKPDRGRPPGRSCSRSGRPLAGDAHGEGVTGEIAVVGDVMADATMRFAPDRAAALSGSGRGRVRGGDRPPRGERRPAPAGADRSGARPPPAAGGLSGASADTCAPWSETVSSSGRTSSWRAARLPAVRRAREPGARDRDRLRRAPEGGLLVRRALRDAAAVDRVGRHGRARRQRARRRRSRSRSWPPCEAAEMPSERPSLYGDGHASERIAAALAGTIGAR